MENADQETLPTLGTKLPALQRSACSTPLTQANRCTKEQDYRPKSTGRKTPTMASPVPGGPFLRPVHQVPLVPHVPIVRPAHQLHPGLVQRMLAQGVHPQHLPILQAGNSYLFLLICIPDWTQVVLGTAQINMASNK